MNERCHEFRDKLSAYADGELPAADEARVRSHLAECEDCRDALATFALMDEAVAAEGSRSEEDWERLAARVDAAVAHADDRDRQQARSAHGWRRKKPGFLGGLLPAPVAFGSAGTIVAALLVVALHGFLEDRREADLLLPEDFDSAIGGRSAPGPAVAETSHVTDRLRALGYVADGPAGSSERQRAELHEIAQKPAADAPPAVEPSITAGTLPEALEKKAESAPVAKSLAPRPVEPTLRMTPSPSPAATPENAAEAARGDAEAIANEGEEEGEVGKVAAAAPESAAAVVDSASLALDTVAETPAEDARTLTDFAREYAQGTVSAPPPPPVSSARDRAASSPKRAPTRPDVMSRALEEQRRETDNALSLALAREVYLFAQERREEGDREGAIKALSMLLDNEHGRIREQAWADLISLEGDKALEEGEVVEIARVASASDAFLREYPTSRFRLGVIKRRVRLWAEAVEQRPDLYCEPAGTAEAEWQAAFGAQTDEAGAEASERIRDACGG